ncbi:phosphate-starvation-inducible PsiE family protein [Variovorax sp. J31P207]|uniref:phosphate-starvation-inducible PsiE family protein n=1 Tax=Variovorax sp. J31P207 TaxID=3053510 RepID=UPI0025784C05|nr:phosphate-starvation-inducible PsiE family protein [Variovorax sp. J31P207]MDM0067116.1 phosphate-starvation-inducible PsiE family protein [Variovorax sp. J31P207]
MQEETNTSKITKWFERSVLVAAQVLLMAVILAMVVQLWIMFSSAIVDQFGNIDSVPELMKSVQTAFSGVLLIILGLELMETLRVYFKSHRIRLETILAVAIIAVGRHVINLDVEHMAGSSLVGVAAIVLALAGGYYLVRTRGRHPRDIASRDGDQVLRGAPPARTRP